MTDLFELDGLRELPAEGEVSDGDVVEDDAELLRPLRQLRVDRRRDDLPLRDELTGVEPRHHRLQDLFVQIYLLSLELLTSFSSELLVPCTVALLIIHNSLINKMIYDINLAKNW